METEIGHDGQGSTHQWWLWIAAMAKWTWLYVEKDTVVTRVDYCVQHMRL